MLLKELITSTSSSEKHPIRINIRPCSHSDRRIVAQKSFQTSARPITRLVFAIAMNNGALHKGALPAARRSTILERNNNKVSLAGFPRGVDVRRASHRPIASLAHSQLAANSLPCVRARANARISCLTVVSRGLVTRVTSLFSIKPLDDELLNNIVEICLMR